MKKMGKMGMKKKYESQSVIFCMTMLLFLGTDNRKISKKCYTLRFIKKENVGKNRTKKRQKRMENGYQIPLLPFYHSERKKK